MSKTPLWLKVLLHFDGKGYFSNGLTIPFLLGASSVISPDDKAISVEEFLSQITDESLPVKISIQRCGNIGEYVIGIFDKESPSALYRNFGNLFITDSSFSTIDRMDHISPILIGLYQHKADQGLFSINHREWGNYSQKETDHLSEVKPQEF